MLWCVCEMTTKSCYAMTEELSWSFFGRSSLCARRARVSRARISGGSHENECTLGQTGFSASRLAKDSRARAAEDDSLGVREDSRDGEAAGLNWRKAIQASEHS